SAPPRATARPPAREARAAAARGRVAPGSGCTGIRSARRREGDDVRGWIRLLAGICGAGVALAAAGGAWAPAAVSPPVALDDKLQQFTLSVPTEKDGAFTSEIELTVPPGFAIDSFEPPTAGWKMAVSSAGSGESAVVQKVTWTGGHVPTDQDA